MSKKSTKVTVDQPPPLPTLAHLLIEAGVTSPPAPAWEIELGQQPWRHQCDLINRLVRYDRYGVYDEPGTGKTLPAMAAGLLMALMGNRVLVIMPPVLLFQLRCTLRAVFKNYNRFLTLHQLSEGPDKRRKLIEEWGKGKAPDLLLMSYDIFRKEWEQAQRLDYAVLIADEAHALKSPASKVYDCVTRFLGPVGERAFWPMTGTPIPNGLEDAYGLISLVTPGVYMDYAHFERRHCRFTKMKIKVNGRERQIPKLVGYYEEDVISSNLYRNARRVLRRQVLDVDDPQIVPMPVDLHPKHRALYRQIVRTRRCFVNGEMVQANNQPRLRQMLLQCVARPDLFTDEKIPNHLEEWLDQLRESINTKHNKLVVVCHFQDTVDFLVEKFRAEGTNPAVVYGGKYKMSAEKAMGLFNDDPNCREMILQPKSGGAGLDMQKASHYMALYEPMSTPGDFDQTIARVCRGGQTEPVSIFYPQVFGTAMMARFENCVEKKRRSDEVTLSVTDFLKEMFGDEQDQVEEMGPDWTIDF